MLQIGVITCTLCMYTTVQLHYLGLGNLTICVNVELMDKYLHGHWIHFHTSAFLNSLGSIQLLVPFAAATYFTVPAPPTILGFILIIIY